MALIIAGERSGVGKTTVTLALLSFLARQYGSVQSFKVGPDYIDPMFHSAVTSRPCRNLDPVLTSETYIQACFARHTQGVNLALVEGVMGLFDGIPFSGERDFASTAHIARLLDLPVLLVIDCSRLSGSVAAIAQGYRSLDGRVKIAGVVLNRVGSDCHLELLSEALEPLNLAVLGVLRRQDSIQLPDRHLGLVPTEEIAGMEEIFERLATLAQISFNWEALLPLLQTSPRSIQDTIPPDIKSKARIAVARDRAFNFYYADNLDLLQQLGAEITYWSPLKDETLPKGTQGLYLGGGFPEVFAEQLTDNYAGRMAVQAAIEKGIPVYAECGGLMYLCEQITDFEGKSWDMVGTLPTTAVMGKKLTLGYRQATAIENSFFWQTGETVWGHEFHRSSLTHSSLNPLFNLKTYRDNSPSVAEGWRSPQNLHASYLHLHWGTYPEIPQRFLSLSHQTHKGFICE